jgi:phosphatidylserine/phosphatidylglycerophosphate/cardiolipin synthase-like enzyme
MEKNISNNLTISEKTKSNNLISIKDNENDIDSTNEQTNSAEDVESIYTHHFVPFSIKLQLIKRTKLSEILKKDLSYNSDNSILDNSNSITNNQKYEIEKDENLVHFKVRYESEDDAKFTWDLFKTYKEIKALLLQILSCVHRGSIQANNTTPLVFRNLPLLARLDYEEYVNCILQIIDMLNTLLGYRKIRDQIFFLEFLEISRHSFDCFNEGNKPKEGYIKKRAGSRSHSFLFNCLCGYLINCCCNKFQVRWFVLKDDMICYLDSSSDNIGKDVFWFDQELILQKDFDGKNTLGLINGTRTLILKFSQSYEREIWYDLIQTKIQLYQSSVKNLYDSFANEKNFCNAKWFVDADSYFEDLHEKLMSAKESIYIAGWWVSPEIFLKRPINLKTAEESSAANPVRLMDILKQKAEEGVMINLLIFKEVKLALSLDSIHTKSVFNKLHKNIKVTRHPKKNLDLLWSHHEKIVIIDQRVGYLGGIDLCWGRYDTPAHKIHEAYNENEIYHWPGIDYCNSRINDFYNVSHYHIESVDRHTCARMPWHDISVYLEGPVVSDLCRHFVERWNFARTDFRFVQNKKYTITNVKKTRTLSRNSKNTFKKQGTATNNNGYNSEASSGLRTPLLDESEHKKIYKDKKHKGSFLNIFSKPSNNYSNYNIYQEGGYHSDNNRKSINKIKKSNLDCSEIKESYESYENSLLDKSVEHSLGPSQIFSSHNHNSSHHYGNLKSSNDNKILEKRDPNLYTINEKKNYSEIKPRYNCNGRDSLNNEVREDFRNSLLNRRSTTK